MGGGLKSPWPTIGEGGSPGKNSGKNPPSEVGVLDVTPIRQMDESRSCSLKQFILFR